MTKNVTITCFVLLIFKAVNSISYNQETEKRINDLQLDTSKPTLWNMSLYKKIIEVLKATATDGPIHDKIFNPHLEIDFKYSQLYRIDEAYRVMMSRIRVYKRWIEPRVGAIWPANSTLDGLPSKVGHIYIKRSQIWTPVVPIRNIVKPIAMLTIDSLGDVWIRVRPGGVMEEFNEEFVQTSCEVSVLSYPYDTIYCYFIFNGIGGVELGKNSTLTASRDTAEFFVPNSEWSVLEVTGDIDEEGNGKVRVKLRRHVTDTFFYLVIPGVIITSVSFLQFLLPPRSGERTGVGVTCMLSMVVFMTMLEAKFSPDENNIPRLARYFALTTGIITLTTAVSVIVIMINAWADIKKGGPKKQVYQTFAFLAKTVCYNDQHFGVQTAEIRSNQHKQEINGAREGMTNTSKSNNVVQDIQYPSSTWLSIGAILDRLFFVLTVFIFLTVALLYLTPPSDYWEA